MFVYLQSCVLRLWDNFNNLAELWRLFLDLAYFVLRIPGPLAFRWFSGVFIVAEVTWVSCTLFKTDAYNLQRVERRGTKWKSQWVQGKDNVCVCPNVTVKKTGTRNGTGATTQPGVWLSHSQSVTSFFHVLWNRIKNVSQFYEQILLRELNITLHQCFALLCWMYTL